MYLWLKRATLVTTAIVTLGLTMPVGITKAHETDHSPASKSELPDKPKKIQLQQSYGYIDPAFDEGLTYKDVFKTDAFLQETIQHAYLQGLLKFGPKISERIASDYEESILPKFYDVIENITQDVDPEDLHFIKVSNTPAGGNGEKIMHVYDERDGNDIVRFHVRRENPPRQGYWFDFHYHMKDDNFEEHYNLGKIYWDKNTPPLWQA
ncbi:YpjP family protein [Bacillus alkalicellulosilyticus]|uniref:YpjP family protein n=1 Tax=Alkalihalobacterium alkalicellulosilyticum TaxID=1912214 RepID=UPI0009968292|nr:YpjP family protein [Bacillus alkalicellulosilyticus]